MTCDITWYGHAALGLKTGGYTILIDPFITDNPVANVNANELNPDFILVSHGHGDHLGDTIPIAKRTGALVISNHEISVWLSNQGVTTHGQHIGGGHEHPFGYLKLTQALHGSGLPDGSYGGNPAGFLMTTKEGLKIYFAGDTGLFSDMKLIGEEGIDMAILPIGDNFTMGPDDALRAVKFLNPKHVLPIHYNTFELISQDANSWSDRVIKETGAKVHVLKPGESITI
ncbi:MAG: metal-dependent hydrolase [Anaerolineales bacterium]|nr:metal-dependent hydrolase [Anaerolineales bacterium]